MASISESSQPDFSDLKTQILSLGRLNAHRQHYIPYLALDKLLTHAAIFSELKRVGIAPYRLQEITKATLANGKRIFAILVNIQQTVLVAQFIEHSLLHDQNLPLLDDKSIFSSDQWVDFFATQWKYIAPRFNHGTISRRFESKKYVFPFQKDEKISCGSFGTVYEIELDEKHQELPTEFSQRLVRKEMASDVDHALELDNLAMLKSLKHPNIIELLCSYRSLSEDKTCYNNIIFPLAEGGDLEAHLEMELGQNNNSPFQSYEKMFVGCVGLSSAVQLVHNFVDRNLDLDLIGLHRDLRPKNILVSNGTFLLADFGLSKFKKNTEDSKSLFRVDKDHYLAPECRDAARNYRKGRIGRASEIWSFGCILLNMLVYMISGPQAVRKFRDNRRYEIPELGWEFYYYFKGSSLNTAVEDVMRDLPDTHIKNLISQMLSVNPDERPVAREVTANLELVALGEIIQRLNPYFDVLRQRQSSLDASLQVWRFSAWKHGLRLPFNDKGDSIKQINGVLDFSATTKALRDMKDMLQTLSPWPEDERKASHTLRHIEQINDSLMGQLFDHQREKAAWERLGSEALASSLLLEVERSTVASGNITLDRHIRQLAAIKRMTELSENDSGQIAHDKKLCSDHIKHPKDFDNHLVAQLDEPGKRSVNILIEWRAYGSTEGDDNVSDKIHGLVERQVNVMSLPKPVTFRTLPCLGYYHEATRARFGIAYELGASDCNEKLRTLHKLFGETELPIHKQPPLDQKYDLALALVQSVLEFHKVRWLHKALTSQNIIFIPRGGTGIYEQLGEPRVIGLNFSRPNEPSVPTEPTTGYDSREYEHPQYREKRTGFVQEYDYYSLGVVLLEIGYWRPLSSWTTTWAKKHPKMSPHQLKDKLLSSKVPSLGQLMGVAYQEAVKRCLEGNFDIPKMRAVEQGIVEDLDLAFNEQVVCQIERRLG